MAWQNCFKLGSQQYVCGYCGYNVASDIGYYDDVSSGEYIYICPNCKQPTYFRPFGEQVPSPVFGGLVEHISSKEVESLYNEARNCMKVSAYTAAILCCRKLLMNIAVSKEAKEGLTFIEYIDFLAKKGFVPPDGGEWVDHIRKKGNEANHQITIMKREDAEELIIFIEMLLKFIYEFPAKIKAKKN